MGQIHLIITDYCMPEMSGYELLKQLKAKCSETFILVERKRSGVDYFCGSQAP
jgi:CheY-like chemotaxis protein